MSRKRSERKKKSLPRGTSSLNSAFTSGHDTVFASGIDVFISGRERRKKKNEPSVPWPGEETIVLTEEKDGGEK
jgi:hypothetical protein